MSDVKQDIVLAVRDKLMAAESHLCWAKEAISLSDPSQQWGASGRTLRELHDHYSAAVERWKRALAEACR